MKHRKSSRISGGLPVPANRPNGHAPDTVSSRAPLLAAAVEETPHHVASPRGGVSTPRDIAAPRDACDSSVAGAANTGAACPDREACAGAAPPRPSEEKQAAESKFAGPTEIAALENGPSFVRAVARRVDLVGISASLVCSKDEKICKAELDRLRQLLFADAEDAGEAPRIDFGDLAKPPLQP